MNCQPSHLQLMMAKLRIMVDIYKDRQFMLIQFQIWYAVCPIEGGARSNFRSPRVKIDVPSGGALLSPKLLPKYHQIDRFACARRAKEGKEYSALHPCSLAMASLTVQARSASLLLAIVVAVAGMTSLPAATVLVIAIT